MKLFALRNMFVSERRGRLFIVSGPSGVGKTTVVTKFLHDYGKKCQIERVVTYTTKKPRDTELDGRDYYFISQEEFVEKIEEGFFLEWSGEYGAYYGTQASILKKLDMGVSQILVIDRTGAQQIIKQYSQACLIWLSVSSLLELKRRLVERKTESNDQINQRLLRSKKEVEEEKTNSIYKFNIVNDCLKSAVLRLFSVISSHNRCL